MEIISLSKKATEHKFNGYTCTECFSVSSFFNNIAPLVNAIFTNLVASSDYSGLIDNSADCASAQAQALNGELSSTSFYDNFCSW